MSFKLLAIRPLPGTHPDFLKNLKPGVIYKFYHEYSFNAEEYGDISRFNNSVFNAQLKKWVYEESEKVTEIACELPVKVTPSESQNVPANLYNIKGGPSINISAVVGKNGSGKSSLVEFFTRAVYKMATFRKEPLNASLTDIYEDKLIKFEHVVNQLFVELKKRGLDWRELLGWDGENPLPHYKGQIKYDSIQLFARMFDTKNSTNERISVTHDLLFAANELRKEFGLNIIVNYELTDFIQRFFNIIDFEYSKILKAQSEVKELELMIKDKLNFEIYFSLKEDNKESFYCITSKNPNSYGYLSRFYTILLNYSNNGLNTKFLGKWIHSLFHKNDAYQTPIVLNPYRFEGNVNINTEHQLLRNRIIGDVLSQIYSRKYKITIGKYTVTGLKFKLKHNYYTEIVSLYDTLVEKKSPFSDFINVLRLDVKKGNVIRLEQQGCYSLTLLRGLVYGYIIRKYEKLETLHNRGYDNFEDFIVTDRSHVVQKFKSAVNFYVNLDVHQKQFEKNGIEVFKEFYLSTQQVSIWLDELVSTEEVLLDFVFEFSILFEALGCSTVDDFLLKLNEKSCDVIKACEKVQYFDMHQRICKSKDDLPHSRIRLRILLNQLNIEFDEFLERFTVSKDTFIKGLKLKEDHLKLIFIQSLFEIDYELECGNDKLMFNGLSSGEFQSLMNVQTILYHYNNLRSIKNASRFEINKRGIYQAVNIILDEVELNYHPELQRNIVSDLIKAFENLDYDSGDLKNINILFFTHSPFILSDIPSANILRLEDGRPIKSENGLNSFASNIHDLLNDEFFLEKGTIGEFAREKLEQLSNKSEFNIDDELLIDMIGDQFLKSYFKEKLAKSNLDKESKERRIKMLEDELKRLKND